MFTSIKIHNFKSCKLVDLNQIGHVVALVGRNGSGKSNILAAIQEGAARAISNIPFDLKATGVDQSGVVFEIKLGEEKFRYTLKIREISTNENTGHSVDWNSLDIDHEETIEIEEGAVWKMVVIRKNSRVDMIENGKSLQIGPMTPCLPALVALLPPDNAVVRTASSLISFLRQVRYYHFDEPSESGEFTEIIGDRQYRNWAKSYHASSESEVSIPIKILHMKLTEPTLFEELSSLLGPSGIGLMKEIRMDFINLNSPATAEALNSAEDDARLRFHSMTFFPENASYNARGSKGFRFKDLSLVLQR